MNLFASRSRRLGLIPLLLFLIGALPLFAAEPVDHAMVTRIRQEGLRRSQVMETLTALTEEVGPRLTGSPGYIAATAWAEERFRGWGFERVYQEEIPFGEGWSFSRTSVHALAPFAAPLHALPLAWSVGTDGPVRGPAIRGRLASEADFEALRGKLRGKVLFIDPEPEEVRGPAAPRDPAEERPYRRYDEKGLADLETYRISGWGFGGDWATRARKRWDFSEARNRFLVEEGALATVEKSTRPHGILYVVGGGGGGVPGRSRGVPGLVMAEAPYGRVTRALDAGREVEIEIDVAATFHPDRAPVGNVFAEIPGSDRREEIVMAGAHLDSWHAGTGATDNGAGVAVVMEAARILEAIGVKPRRTIRFALWAAEEQGLLGSRAYAKAHLASRPAPEDPEEAALPDQLWRETWPLQLKPGHAKHSVYFNLDTGSGRIRGISAMDNVAAAEIFRAWLAPFADLGATAVSLRGGAGTDHASFDGVGVPAFGFIQDGLEYMSRTWHSDLDTLERASREDLMQAATVMASFLYHAAMRDEPFPRKPLPEAPAKAN
jgi:hypothetical protein